MSSLWQEGCIGRCQDCANACPHIPNDDQYKRLMTFGPVRYGMRVGAVSPPPPGAGPRYRTRTCCWPAAPHDTTARIPLLPVSPLPINSLDIISCANRSDDAVTSDQTQTVRDHVPYSGSCLLNKHCALVYSRLVDVDPKDEITTLDRLPRFRFGGNRAEKRTTDKFRELTERLKRNAISAPVPPPRRHTRSTPPPPEPPVVAVTAQRAAPLPSRSASFSQVDYCSDDNKYVRCNNNNQEGAGHNTLPRLKKLNQDVPELQITCSESAEKTLEQDKRRDKSRRRKGIYISQWPTDDILPPYRCSEPSPSIIIGGCSQEEPLLSPPDESNLTGSEWPKDSLSVSVSRSSSLLRSDSLSEGEPDRDQVSLAPSDLSDCETNKAYQSGDSPGTSAPTRYSKRPLIRGPYGQMLEAEIKKPETRKNLNSDLKFLEDLSTSSATSKGKSVHSRGLCNSSIDETLLREIKPVPVAKRKVSADNLVVEPIVKESLTPNHQRTTSSPSKLEAFPNTLESSSEVQDQLQPLRGSSEQLEVKEPPQLVQNDTRTHVLIELFDNERIYVESLEIIVLNYWEPLKKAENQILEQNLVEEIFSQIPFLLNHHRGFLLKLKVRLETYETRATIGDLFTEMLTVPEVVEHYVNYVNNWKRSRDIIKNAQTTRPQFAKFLETASKNNLRKLALDSLLIKPIQKFPKCELLLQRLLKHTPEDHPDFELLTKAEKEVHDLLVKLNCTEKEALEIEQLREIENAIEGVLDLVVTDRQFIRHDMVVMSHSGGPRKERALFLLTDLLLITGIKRRSGTITKKTTTITNTSNLDANKYKLMMKVPLEDVEIVRSKDDNMRQMQLEVNNLNEDLNILNKINELSNTLHCNNSNLDEVVKEMIAILNKQLQIQQNSDIELCVLDLTILTQNGIELLSIVFPKAEVRACWEETLIDCKIKLGDRRPTPEMMATVPIRKTRAGLQFTCAAPTLSDNGRDIWVCNSDGYVGQVCILTLNEKPEPAVTSCNSVCNTRILCIVSVPGPGIPTSSRVASFRVPSFTCGKNRDKLQPQKALQLDSSSSSDEEDKPKEDEPKEPETSSVHFEEPDKLSTMWLGTEDGCIHIYNSNDNIRIKKNKVKLQLGSSILCLIYLEHKVFASQANGFVLIYERDGKGGWNTANPRQITIGNSSTPVSKMVVCNAKLLCACGNAVVLFNPSSFEKETVLTIVSNESNKPPQNPPISCLLLSGSALWISLQNSAVIKCFNSVTYELICETSVAPAVQKMLTSCDDIIRQHKAACLRVTALVHCKDLLWIGTSAGVLLTMPLPHVTPTTGKLSGLPPITGVPHGHTGQVRILTSVEMPYPMPKKGTPSKKSSKNKLLADIPQVKTTKTLVISGGDGYEDFRTSNMSEVAGREDSTNHLLLWNI